MSNFCFGSRKTTCKEPTCEKTNIIKGNIPSEYNPFIISDTNYDYTKNVIKFLMEKEHIFVQVGDYVIKFNALERDFNLFKELRSAMYDICEKDESMLTYKNKIDKYTEEAIEKYFGTLGIPIISGCMSAGDGYIIVLRSQLCYLHIGEEPNDITKPKSFMLDKENLMEELANIDIDTRRYIPSERKVKNHELFRLRVLNLLK